MRRTEHIRARGMDGRVDHKGSRVEHAIRAAVNDFAVVVDLDQVRGFNERERRAEGIHPERAWVDGVAQGDVAGHACRSFVSVSHRIGAVLSVLSVQSAYPRRSRISRRCGMQRRAGLSGSGALPFYR